MGGILFIQPAAPKTLGHIMLNFSNFFPGQTFQLQMTEKTIRKEEHPKLQLSCQTHRDSIGFQMLLFFSLDYPSILSSSAREQEHSSCPRGSDSRCQTPHCTGSDQKGHDFNSKSHQKDGCSISRKSLVLRRNSDHLSCRTCAGHWIFCFSQQCKCFRGLLPEQ